MRKNITRPKIVSGINITPLTDIALVLLVIFMVTTPMLMEAHIKVNLPKAVGAQSEQDKGILVVIDSLGRIFINDEKIEFENLSLAFTSLLENKPDAPIIINGDKDVKYDTVIKVVDIARRSGAKKFSLGIEISNV